MKLLIATRNKNKLKEFQALLTNSPVTLISPDKIPSIPKDFDVPETGATFKANATLKAKTFGKLANLLTLADDSGLCIDYLNGQPGINSARFCNRDFTKAKKHLLQLLKVVSRPNRTAQFTCVLALFDPQTNSTKTFSGTTHGYISDKESGTAGFGYDSIFIPKNSKKTFAQISKQEKNQLSHRALAFKKLINYLTIHTHDRF